MKFTRQISKTCQNQTWSQTHWLWFTLTKGPRAGCGDSVVLIVDIWLKPLGVKRSPLILSTSIRDTLPWLISWDSRESMDFQIQNNSLIFWLDLCHSLHTVCLDQHRFYFPINYVHLIWFWQTRFSTMTSHHDLLFWQNIKIILHKLLYIWVKKLTQYWK